MGTDPLLPDASTLRLKRVEFTFTQVTISMNALLPAGSCPVCGDISSRVHS